MTKKRREIWLKKPLKSHTLTGFGSLRDQAKSNIAEPLWSDLDLGGLQIPSQSLGQGRYEGPASRLVVSTT